MSPELKAQGLYKKKGSVVRLVNDQVLHILHPHCTAGNACGISLPGSVCRKDAGQRSIASAVRAGA